GGPYYEKAVFSLEALWAMDVVYEDYTLIDNMPSVVIDHVAGVPLAELMDVAGIDLGSIQSFNFWTNDKQGAYYTSLTKSFLLDTPRYRYYSLPDNFDYDTGAGNAYATADAARVPTVLALADDWNRVLAGASFGSDYLRLNAHTRFRLVFGQTDAHTRTASSSAKWVHSIEVTLGGAPTLTMDASVLDLEVGSRFRSEASLSDTDPVIAANAEILWSSSDESVATVDASGEIAVHGEGTATVTARFGGASASVLINGKPGGGASGAEEAPPAAAEEAEAADAPLMIGRELSILPPPEVASEDDVGGVQNSREEELGENAVELPIIPEENPLLPAAAAVACALFALGGATKFARFKAGLRLAARGAGKSHIVLFASADGPQRRKGCQ
ncbi:MAG: Ig-like domain-containing protein, partial [Clostridiales Family XIII bacterium]|nr:Ig-like domain-containing protein [Clostridiales Family XIII bacterium]